MKKLIIIGSITTLFAGLSLQAQASDGTINFTGSVQDVTCTIQVNAGGTGNGTITLPAVSSTALKGVGTTAGDTAFTINLSGCAGTGVAAGPDVAVFFEPGANVVDGRLKNTGLATGVDLAIYHDGTILPLGTSPTNAFGKITGTSPDGLADMPFTVKYYSTVADGPTAGTVLSSVTYSVVYP